MTNIKDNIEFNKLWDERNALAHKLADWRRRWDALATAERGTAEHSMAGLKPLDDYAFEIASADQSAPSLDGGGTQPPLPVTGSAAQ